MAFIRIDMALIRTDIALFKTDLTVIRMGMTFISTDMTGNRAESKRGEGVVKGIFLSMVRTLFRSLRVLCMCLHLCRSHIVTVVLSILGHLVLKVLMCSD